MKIFIIKIIVFFAVCFIAAFSLQKLIDRGLKNSSIVDFKEWNDITKSKINADLIIQGNSRATLHFSPGIIDSSLNINSYNIGIYGYHFHMQYYRFLLYLKNNKKPKYIIQNVDHFTLTNSHDLYNSAQFLPYLNNDIIREAISGCNGLDWRDNTIPLYKYRSNFNLPVEGIRCNFQASYLKSNKYKGFLAEPAKWDKSFKTWRIANPDGWRVKIDDPTVNLFTKYLDICKSQNIKVIFVYTPEYFESQKLLHNRDSVTNIFKEYSVKYDIPFLDYSNSGICLDTINFTNSQHMNSVGVKKFNLLLCNDLRKYINLQ